MPVPYSVATPLYHLTLSHKSPHWNVIIRNTATERIAVQYDCSWPPKRVVLQPEDSTTLQFRAPPKFKELKFWIVPTKKTQVGPHMFKVDFEHFPQGGCVRRSADETLTLTYGGETYVLSAS